MPRVPIHIWLLETVVRAAGAVGAAWERMVGPIEWFLANLFGRSLAATEHLERADSLLMLVVRILWAPIWLAQWLAKVLLPGPVRQWASGLGAALGFGLYRAGAAIVQFGELLNLDVVVVWLVWLAWPLWRPFAAVLGFMHAWLVTRNARQFLLGLPALVLVAPFAVVAVLASTNGHSSAVPAYREALEAAAAANQFELVQLYEQKLLQLGASTQLQTYRRAEQLAADGKLEAAYELMRQLATEHEPGYPQAHVWIVQQLVQGKLDVSTEARGALLDRHLAHLTTLGIESPGLTLVQATRLAARGEAQVAADLLAPVAADLPEAAFEKLRLDYLVGRSEELRGDAEAALRHLEKLERSDQPLTASHLAIWTAALEILDRRDKLEQVYRQWTGEYPADERAREGLVRLLVQRCEQQIEDPSANPPELARLLSEIGALGPPSGWLTRQMARLYELRDNAIVPNHLPEQTIGALLAANDTPPLVLEALGVRAVAAGEMERAVSCFKKVTELWPDLPTGWNNYAWVLAQLDDSRLDDALAAVNRALSTAPSEHRFRETRGQILVKLARWDEAISDLEFAINGMPEARQVHQALATAYDAVGDAELAAAHRQQVGSGQ